MKLDKIKDDNSFMKDRDSKAVVNVDNDKLEAYKNKRQKNRQIDRTIKDVEQLKSDVGEIKSLLHQLINNNGK
ncbi:hypothetical protein [Methanohalobium sp.]|uniref:hypothetical protein n=1 Tax=Methanohalobium sp. TaxID=2837493 RepID=UPI0025EEACE6|nr:hypothetical protein [Methanohalobium sp.]